jgi:hypothetical protein
MYTRIYFMNIICINNLLPSDFQPCFFGKALVTAQSSLSSNYIASQLLLREPIRMLKGHFSILKLY